MDADKPDFNEMSRLFGREKILNIYNQRFTRDDIGCILMNWTCRTFVSTDGNKERRIKFIVSEIRRRGR